MGRASLGLITSTSVSGASCSEGRHDDTSYKSVDEQLKGSNLWLVERGKLGIDGYFVSADLNYGSGSQVKYE
jgi:hypothetical protein